MDQNFSERREFYRIDYKKPVKFIELGKGKKSDFLKAVSKNISQSGILFLSKSFPKISSVIWISLPLKELAICKEIEDRVITVKKGILGRVVRVEENEDTKDYSVGVCFVKKGERDIKTVAKDLEKSLADSK